MAWKDEVEDGVRELIEDGAGLLIGWRGFQIPAIQGSGVSYDALANGGFIDNENPSLMVIKSDLDRISGGQQFEQGDEIEIGDRVVIVKNISLDLADPTIRIETEGPEQ